MIWLCAGESLLLSHHKNVREPMDWDKMYSVRVQVILFILVLPFVRPISGDAQTPFEILLQDKHISQASLRDWSDSTYIEIAQPSCAYINITGIDDLPRRKNKQLTAWMDIYDGLGNFFRKRAYISAQGNSSLGFVKRNFKADFSASESETPTFAIGDWVDQDVFHFKAYYIDFFRGIGCVAYQLFHQTQADRGPMWGRAIHSSANPLARCYPDGFPCLVYLNGEFYGIYTWQLKKDRNNMNQLKDVAEHIHLDGNFEDRLFWGNYLDWTQFEIRNPKGLYCMDGQPYDGDNPQELMDETSDFYDLPEDSERVKAAKERSASVKRYIKAFSKFSRDLAALERTGASAEVIRAEMQQRFDIPSLIDYVCFSYYVNNYDGFWKNWQWFTYDGTKWFVAPYDLDCTFGNHASGNFIIPPEWNYEWGNYSYISSRAPIDYLRKYYWEDLKERYAELRMSGVFSTTNVKSLLKKWCNRIGQPSYNMEWQKWPDCKCIGQTICNETWTTSDDWSGYSKLPDYNDSTTYLAGDKCKAAERIWTATTETRGVRPYAQLGYTDSLERVFEWVNRRTELIDLLFDFEAPLHIAGNHISPTAPHVIYNMSGQRLRHLQKGINIVGGKKILIK